MTLEQYHFYDERLAWLPTGRELLFSFSGSDSQSSSSLWRVSASGGTPERLGVAGDNAANPAVSLRGNRLAYERRRADANIWKIALPQSTRPAPAPAQLIVSSRQEHAPHFSPDGARIAFLSDRSGSIEIWLGDTAGSNLVQLTTSGGSFGTPRWSPDSRQLAVEGYDKVPPGIYVISVEGGLPRPVTTDSSVDVLASWSSDGRWIYFGSNRTGRFELWKVRAEGGHAVQVTKRGGFRGFESADGKFVYYVKGFGISGVWKAPVDGGAETAVLDFPKAQLVGLLGARERRDLFRRRRGHPATRSPVLRLWDEPGLACRGPGQEADRVWPGIAISPDGGWLLYTQVDSHSSDIMLVENFH